MVLGPSSSCRCNDNTTRASSSTDSVRRGVLASSTSRLARTGSSGPSMTTGTWLAPSPRHTPGMRTEVLCHGLLWLALISLLGCDDDGRQEGSSTGTRSGTTTAYLANTPEPWTLGAVGASNAPSLPPPCRERAATMRAALARASRIAAARHSLGRLLVAEGSTHPRWHPDAAGLMNLERTPAQVVCEFAQLRAGEGLHA